MEAIQQLPVRRVGTSALNQESFPSIINESLDELQEPPPTMIAKSYANHTVMKLLTCSPPAPFASKKRQGGSWTVMLTATKHVCLESGNGVLTQFIHIFY